MAEYGSMFTVSGLAAILFFGGWNGPFPLFDGFLTDAMVGLLRGVGLASWAGLAVFVANLAGCANFLLKTVAFVTVMMWVRWTLPRLRIDQVMTTCLKYCVPLAALCFLGALGWQVGGCPSLGDLLGTRVSPYSVRESWVLQEMAARPISQAMADREVLR